MIKKINIFLVLLLLLLSIGAVSAADDMNSTVMGSDDAISDVISSNADEEVLTSNSYVVTEDNYSTYFNNKGNLIATFVNAGDTLEIDGVFSNKNFTFTRQINIVGTSTNHIKNGVFTFTGSSSGSTISNLKITNTKDYLYGIFLNGVSNCTVQGCIINNTGQSSYGICVANDATYNNIINNEITTYGKTYGHLTRSTPPMLLSRAHYNYIANNHLECDDANAIYLSSYAGGPLVGGLSTFNTIHNNTINYNVFPTSWAYGIQIMGGNNTISSNTIIGGYRGVSTTEAGNIIVDNWIINLRGADYNHPTVPSGGEMAILGSANSIIRNNHIVNASVISSGAAISALDNSVVENNYVEVVNSGVGIYPRGSNVTVRNNTVITNSGSAVYYKGQGSNIKVLDNMISSNTGIGVLFEHSSEKAMPSNITVVGNNISTSNKYAIDAAQVNESSVNVIGPNIIKKGCEVRTPEGSYDPSKPAYIFNGTVYNINPSNIRDYINDNGGLSSEIKAGDILNFTGEFYGNSIIFINSAVKFTGYNAVFYNTTFRISCKGVWIENLVIRNAKADRVNAWGIVAYKMSGATITNCDIYVEDPNAAYAIYVVEATDIDVINNTLSSSGDRLTYTLLAYAVEDCKFINNTIYTLGTGEVHVFESEHCLDGDTNCLDGDTNCLDGDTNCLDGDTNCLDGDTNCLDGDTNCLDGDTNCLDGDTNCLDGDTNCLDGSSIGDGNHVLSEVYRTYGILMAYSSGNNVTGNKVNVTSKLNRTVSTYNSTNSLVGIDLYFNSHNNNFTDNEVYIKANDNYIYGMGVLGYTTGHDAPKGEGATNNRFVNNYIVIDGTYCVEGIIIGHESKDTIIQDNIIKLTSDNVAYGVTLEMSHQSTISNNYLELRSDAIYGIEAFSSDNNTIENNDAYLHAKQVYGILFSNSNNNYVSGNEILANGTGENITFQNFDSIRAANTGIFLKSFSTNNKIINNRITSQKGYAILVDDEATGNIITDNYLDSEKGIGNGAVNNTQNNVVEDNYVYTFGGRFNPSVITATYLGTAKITLTNIGDGALVKFYVTVNNVEYYIASEISSNDAATVNYKLNESFPYSKTKTYKIKAVVSKENYKTKEISATLRVNTMGSLNIVLSDVSAKVLNDATFVATVSDIDGNPVSGVVIKFKREGTYFGVATTGSNGVAKVVSTIPSVSGDEFNIAAVFEGSDNINEAVGNAILTINTKDNINLTLNDAFTDPGVDVTLTASVKDDSANAISGKTVKFYARQGSSDVYIGEATTGSDGVARLTYAIPSEFGDNCFISARVDGNDEFNFAVDQAILKYNKKTLNVLLNDVSAHVNDENTFRATVKDIPGHLISDVNVKFYIIQDGENVYIGEATTGVDGVAILNYVSAIPAGEYVISAVAVENDNYYSADGQSAFSIEKYDTNIDASDVTAIHKDGSKLVATLTDESGHAISGAKLKIVINKVSKYISTDANGQVALSLDNYDVGSYTATITFVGNDLYNKATATAEIIITDKLDTVLTAPDVTASYQDGSKLIATLKDVNGNAISGAKIKIVLNKVSKYISTDANGQVALSLNNLDVGVYDATITFVATDLYNKATTTAKVTINVNKVDTVLTAPDVTAGYKDGSKLVATLKDVNGNAISGAKIKIVINKVSKYISTDANGQVALSLSNLEVGTYDAVITFVATDLYNKASTTAKVTITDKVNTVITAADVTAGYKDGSKLVATIKDTAGNAISGVKIKIVINKVSKYITTDANGQVALTLNNLDVGTYDAVITFVGNDLYNKATTTAKVTITNKINTVLTAPDVTASYQDGSKLVATLKDTSGNAISGAKIKIVLNKVTKYISTDGNGQVALSLNNLNVGSYTATITFVATDLYNKATTTANVTII